MLMWGALNYGIVLIQFLWCVGTRFTDVEHTQKNLEISRPYSRAIHSSILFLPYFVLSLSPRRNRTVEWQGVEKIEFTISLWMQVVRSKKLLEKTRLAEKGFIIRFKMFSASKVRKSIVWW